MSIVRRLTGWFRASLFPKLLTPIALTGVAVLLVSALTSSLFFRDTLIGSFRATEENYLAVQAGNLDTLLKQYSDQLYSAAVDRSLLALAKNMGSQPSPQRSLTELSVREYLETAISSTDISAATLAMADGSFIAYTRLQDTQYWPSWFSSNRQGGYDDALSELCRRAQAARKAVVGTTPRRYNRSGVRLVHLACPVYDLLNWVSYGTLVFSFNTARLWEIVNPAKGADDYAQGILTEAEGVILAHRDDAQAYERFTDGAEDVADAVARGALPQNPLILRRDLDRLGFVLYRVVDQNKLAKSTLGYRRQLALTLGLIVLALLVIVAVMLRRALRSVRALQQGLQAASTGDLAVRVPVTDGTEIGQITGAFNDMAEQLSLARQREGDQARRALDALNRQRVAEIKVLENQINSHFLYNTLNTINYTALESGSINTSRQIKHLANMLRYTFQDSEAVVPAAQEARWLEEYLALQKLRFGKRFDCIVRVSPEVSDWPMRKLIVQPFVENSVLHGFEGIERGGLLTVSFLPYRDGFMRVEIRDNGCGMPPGQLRALRARFADPTVPSENGIGLENARQRLLSYYGGRARVLLRSWPGQGTAVALLLPRYDGNHGKKEG